MEVPDQGHSLFLLDDPSKRRTAKKAGRPFQFAKLPTTDDAAVACTDAEDIDKYNSITVVFNSIKGIKMRKKTIKAKKPSTSLNERSDKGQFGLAPSFGGRRDDGESSGQDSDSDSNVSDYGEGGYEATYDFVGGTDIEFVFYIRSSAWIDTQINTEPQKAVMPKGAVAADGAIYLDHNDDEVEKDVQLAKSRPSKRPKTSHEAGEGSHLLADGDTFFREATSFSETDDDSSDDDDLSPQELARTLHQNPQLYALIKAAAKGTVNLPSPDPEPAPSAFAGHSTSGIAITRRRSAYGQQNEFAADEEGPVAGGSGVGAAGATQAGEEWHGRA